MTTQKAPSKAVFVSYASQDAGAVRRIADALLQGGIEVWLDQSELRPRSDSGFPPASDTLRSALS